MPPKKPADTENNENESFQKFLTSLEEDSDPGSGAEEDDEDQDLLAGQDSDEDMEDEDDDDNDSLNEWMREEEDFIDDNEITQLLNSTLEKRAALKTGGADELERDMEDFDKNLAINSGIGRVKRGVKRKLMGGELRLPEDIKRKLGEANSLYISRDYGNAIAILQEVITNHPQAHPAWNTLGLVHDELGNKSKSLRLRMVAAHLCDDVNLWKELAHKSIENNTPKQAIHCLTKALVIDPTDVDALWDRSFLYKQSGKNAEATEGFILILQIMPHHFKVINELAQLYRSEGKTAEAIKMYEDAIVYHTENPDTPEEEEENEDEFSDKLGFSEINMLSELYLIRNDYSRCLDTIKTGLRLIQNRQDETWWADQMDEDDEYFEEDESRTEFPLELRVRMGVCRVYMGQPQIAAKHFKYLLQYPPNTYPDLHQEIAYAYYDKRHFAESLKVFQKIIDSSEEIEVDLLIRTADCYRETGDLETAVVFYVNVLEEQPENLDVMVSLATVYEDQGKEEEALTLVEFVMKKNRETRKIDRAIARGAVDESQETKENKSFKEASIFDESALAKKDAIGRRKAEYAKHQHEKELKTRRLFERLDEIDQEADGPVGNMDRGLVRDYMRSAQELWEIFYGTRGFYPSTRSRRYDGFYRSRAGRKNQQKVTDLEAQYLADRLRKRVKQKDEDKMDIDDLDEEEKQDLENILGELKLSFQQEFLDVSFDRWCEVFMKYAYMLAMTKRAQEAYNLLKNASEASCFFHSEKHSKSFKFGLLSCGLVAKDYFAVSEAFRWFCHKYKYQSDVFRVHLTSLAAGINNPYFCLSASQVKFVMRVLQLVDSLSGASKEGIKNNAIAIKEIENLDDAVEKMNVNPSSINEQEYKRFYETPDQLEKPITESNKNMTFSRTSPVLLTLAGHMLCISKSHTNAALCFMRSYALEPKDPINLISLALSFFQASCQRRCDNRHMFIMQGMLFLTEYVKVMGPCQESEYNMGYCFHIIGLTHLAIPHYERALCMPSRAKIGMEEMKPIEDVYKWSAYSVNEDHYEDDDEIEYDSTDLKREAAYNLHLIYVTSGAMSLAEILFMKYCTI
ncbi:hypothetical protein BY458DRAFT_525585 [Sporodiniella umbellata]|nr:hypothetical protein BY458DRAFT_525585 [Sporodiniella umbellata]